MDGFCDLVEWLLGTALSSGLRIERSSNLVIPGFFRPTKQWDLLVFYGKELVAALEFKSQAGPSFSNNFNNRAEEAVGIAQDLWTAFREGAFGERGPRPWLGWLMLVENCPASSKAVHVEEPHFPVFPEFHDASYLRRYELLLSRLRTEKLYDGVALLASKRAESESGVYTEPALDLSLRRFLAGLLGHAYAFVEGAR
jgi:type II restriction enzyme